MLSRVPRMKSGPLQAASPPPSPAWLGYPPRTERRAGREGCEINETRDAADKTILRRNGHQSVDEPQHLLGRQVRLDADDGLAVHPHPQLAGRTPANTAVLLPDR